MLDKDKFIVQNNIVNITYFFTEIFVYFSG